MSILKSTLHVIGVVLLYAAALIAPPIMLFLYRQGRLALFALILNASVIGWPVASGLGVWKVHEARKYHVPSIFSGVAG
jgi:hypothetical protein